MISSEAEYQKAREELDYLSDWLARLENQESADRKSLTSASVRRMISRVQEEIAEYEAAGASAPPGPQRRSQPGDAGTKRRTTDRNSDSPE